jgi:hypothetical protein
MGNIMLQSLPQQAPHVLQTTKNGVVPTVKKRTLDFEMNGNYNNKDLWFRKLWRNAVETWLIKHGFITVCTPGKLFPISG